MTTRLNDIGTNHYQRAPGERFYGPSPNPDAVRDAAVPQASGGSADSIATATSAMGTGGAPYRNEAVVGDAARGTGGGPYRNEAFVGDAARGTGGAPYSNDAFVGDAARGTGGAPYTENNLTRAAAQQAAATDSANTTLGWQGWAEGAMAAHRQHESHLRVLSSTRNGIADQRFDAWATRNPGAVLAEHSELFQPAMRAYQRQPQMNRMDNAAPTESFVRRAVFQDMPGRLFTWTDRRARAEHVHFVPEAFVTAIGEGLNGSRNRRVGLPTGEMERRGDALVQRFSADVVLVQREGQVSRLSVAQARAQGLAD